MFAYPYYNEASETNFDLLVNAIQERGGCAVVGAGLSRQAGLPSWEELVENLRKEAGLPPTPFTPLSAPTEMETVRDALGDGYLEALRGQFTLAGKEVPDSYKRLSNVGFKQLATINVDELLHIVARVLRRDDESTIYLYGTDDLVEKRYYYLHGRLETAASGDDLVLCRRDYAAAYGPEGEALRALGVLARAPGPLVFVGSSMADADLQHVLRHVDYYRLSRQGQSERYLSDPSWFAVLPASLTSLVPDIAGYPMGAADKELILANAVARRTNELRPIRVVWYAYDGAHRGLDLLVRQLEQLCARHVDPGDDTFLASARVLDDMALLTSPSENQVQTVVDLIRVRGNRDHFFRTASSVWLGVLWERGELRSFQEPQLGEDGNYYIDAWDAAGLVTRSASAEPETIRRMVLETETANWGVIGILARACVSLPSQFVREAVPAFRRWFATPFISASFAGLSLIELAGRLVDEDEDETALQLFEILGCWETRDGDGQT